MMTTIKEVTITICACCGKTTHLDVKKNVCSQCKEKVHTTRDVLSRKRLIDGVRPIIREKLKACMKEHQARRTCEKCSK